MVEAVVVAAGLSSRAGGWKPAFDLGGLTVIERCLLGMYQYCSRIVVVGGYRFDSLVKILEKYEKVELVYNQDYEEGMLSSVLKGFGQIRGPRFFYLPGDYPLISQTVYETLLKQDEEIVIPAFQGITGHPVLFQTKVVKLLLDSPKYLNLREFIASREKTIVEVADPGVLIDIDTKEDYRQIVGCFY